MKSLTSRAGNKLHLIPALISVFFFSILLTACDGKPLEAPPPPAFVYKVPDNWQTAQQAKSKRKADHIQSHQVAYDWFTNFAFSEVDGIPYIILKLLPELAPEIWGSKDNFLDVVGLFNDERQPTYPIARGIGISAFSRPDPEKHLDYTSFTCGACHIGRVRLDDGKYTYLDGGVNAEFNIVLFRVKIFQTLQKVYAGETDATKKHAIFKDKLLAALERVHQQDPSYFYKNYSYAGKTYDAAYESKQIALFKEDAQKYATKFATRKEAQIDGYGALIKKNYPGFKDPMLAGFPGMADATGISAVNGYIGLKQKPVIKWFAGIALPPTPGITDFMSVWEQDERKADWDEKHERLINGGGQWNGNVPMSLYRNLVASLTLALEETDVRVAMFGEELLGGLPANPYPFDVDITLAKKGEQLFTEHCADCHQPKNGKVYTDLGTDMNRANVVGWILNYSARGLLYDNCSPTKTVKVDGKEITPCAEYEGVSLVGKKDLIMSPYKEHQGYNARPLSGIWAQAPYLHNGSVPTIYHLLVPESRPQVFVKSRLDYDKSYLGYAWDPAKTPASGIKEGYTFKVGAIPALSSKGHDKDLKEGNKTYRLNWSSDKEGAMAIIEYLKTL